MSLRVRNWLHGLALSSAPLLAFPLSLSSGLLSPALAAPKAAYESRILRANTKGRAVDIDVELKDAKKLILVVTDGGDGFGCDWADWAEPRLVANDGSEKKLTDLKWSSASSGWKDAKVNQNAEGQAMKIDGKAVEYGIGTHANSTIIYEIPAGYTRFKARGGLDDGGANQKGGGEASLSFAVYLNEAPPAAQPGKAGGYDASMAVANLEVADGLEAQLFASEPQITSLTNICVDHRGRVWANEVTNYRGNKNTRPEGDRILILEDTDGDGKADKQTVFYQGRDVDSAMGICVLGNKVIVSASPYAIVFTDKDGDDKPDSKEYVLTKTGTPQHDHSLHSFLFGPDGKLYFNYGNTGGRLADKDGKTIKDKAGNDVVDNGKPYWGGMAFRCDPDFTNFETLGHNFRNNYEVNVDSFGTLWQSDNDDDGNKGVRINYVMEFGNFGYKDEKTGAGWGSKRTNMEAETPRKHWHLNDPGVVPNLLITGQGSPTGITVYEGNLLPKVFQGQVIHCDAGPSIVRAYPVTTDGAGYKAEIVNVLDGAKRDKFFRPADVTVAPDGSLFVSDWYDPGVGGHGQKDLDRGRLFRVAPPGSKYVAPKYDFSTAESAVEALKSPNDSARYLAWTALHAMGVKAEAALAKLFESGDNPRHRARALWLLSKLPAGAGKKYVDKALADKDENIRITGLRAARQSFAGDVLACVETCIKDTSAAVRRDCAIALRGHSEPQAAKLWAELASQHDGNDRWYLEALGIGAEKNWDECLSAFLAKVGDKWNTPAARDVIWRSRAKATPDLLAKIVTDSNTKEDEKPRYMRAFDFLSGPEKDAALKKILGL